MLYTCPTRPCCPWSPPGERGQEPSHRHQLSETFARVYSIIIPVDNLPRGQSWTRHGDLAYLDIEVFWTRTSFEVLFDKKFRLCGSVPMTWPIRDWSYVYVLFQQGENLSRKNVQVSERLLLVKSKLQIYLHHRAHTALVMCALSNVAMPAKHGSVASTAFAIRRHAFHACLLAFG